MISKKGTLITPFTSPITLITLITSPITPTTPFTPTTSPLFPVAFIPTSFPMRHHLLICLALLPTLLWGQSDFGLTFLPETYQSTFVNPAYRQSARIQVALPSLSSQIYHSGFTLSQLTRYAGQTDYDPSELINEMPDISELVLHNWVAPFAVAYQHGQWQFGLHTRFQAIDYYGYPKEAFAMVWEGNSQYLGDTVEVGPNFEALLYRETGISASFALGEKLRAGIRLNYLTGLINASTDRHVARLYTNPEYYQIDLEMDYRLRIASQLDLDIDSLVDERTLVFNPRVGDFFGFGGNSGYSMDLGLSFTPTEQWQIDASLVNFGSIFWDNNTRVYTSTGETSFEGLDPQGRGWGPTGDSSLTEALLADANAALDTVWRDVGRVRQDTSYRTALPARFYLSGRYHLNHLLTLGLAWSGQGYQGRMHHLFSAYAGANLGRWLTGGLTYAYHTDYHSLLGLHLRLTGGPVQFFVSSGNVLGLLQPDKVRAFNLTTGLNVVLGREAAVPPEATELE